jgi:hypothetical protein
MRLASLKVALKALARERQQLGRGLQIPVGVLGSGVAQVGREQRHAPLDVPAGAVCVQQRPHREGVAQVVKPRPPRSRARRETGAAAQRAEGPLDAVDAEPGPDARDEQRTLAMGCRWAIGAVQVAA